MSQRHKASSNSRPMKASRQLAREARQRIEMVAERLPRGAFRRFGRGDIEKADRIVVISDTHFGDPYENLTSPDLIERLVETVEGFGQVDELILLGDIFDFWKAPMDDAIARARDFMGALYMLENVRRMIFVPGNHDHHVFRQYCEVQWRNRLKDGELAPPELTMPYTKDCPVMEVLKPRGARVPLYAVYPVHQVSVGDRRVLLTHGHLLGFFERSLWNPKQSRLANLILRRRDTLDLEDMEVFLSPFYEMVALSGMVPGVPDGNYRMYRMLARTGRALGLQGADRESAYRNTTIEQNSAEIETLLDFLCEQNPYYFIYGHTHRAGKLILPLSGTIAVNTGCWLDGEVAVEPRNTVLEISDEARLIRV